LIRFPLRQAYTGENRIATAPSIDAQREREDQSERIHALWRQSWSRINAGLSPCAYPALRTVCNLGKNRVSSPAKGRNEQIR
jgi:hypothetical protein